MKKKIIISTIFIIIIFILIGLVFLKFNKKQLKDSNSIEEITNVENNYKEEKDVYVEYTVSEKWEQNAKNALKYDIKLINKSTTDIQNWNIIFDVNNDTEISQYWNGKLELNNDKLIINPESYNNIVSKTSEISIGFILFSNEETALKSYKLYVDGKEYIIKENTENNIQEDKIEKENQEIKTEMQDNKQGTPVSNHGKLSVNGKNIVDEHGNTFIIQGISTHGIAWFPKYINIDTFKTLRDEFNANTIRIAMYSDVNAGYNKSLHELVSKGVDYATELGMYVIIDWHILSDNNPNQNKSSAIQFFTEMANKYKNYNNVLYEICNEPNGNVTWNKDIKPYAEELIQVIRKIDDDAIIIVGTPTWSQDVDIVSQNQIENQKNIVYALHFYAATHKQDLRNKLKIALNNNLPVLVSEFGISDASGNGIININEGNTWINYLRENGIGYVCWNLSNKNESSSLLNSTTNNVSNWKDEELSEQGKWLKEIYNK